jgi:KUP system potassium uptake protein
MSATEAAAADRLKRHDSLYGDAEKVSGDKCHGSPGVRIYHTFHYLASHYLNCSYIQMGESRDIIAHIYRWERVETLLSSVTRIVVQGSWARTLMLAFQSVGVVYGDIGTSPLYVYSSTFPDGIRHPDDLLGVLSLILYTLILIPMLKYVFVVLHANYNGDGGTFALYSLISRYAKIRMIPDQQTEDATVSNYSVEAPSSRLRRAQWLKEKLESSNAAKIALFTITILGTSMVMGDGTLTPAISGIIRSHIYSNNYLRQPSTSLIDLRVRDGFLFLQCCRR